MAATSLGGHHSLLSFQMSRLIKATGRSPWTWWCHLLSAVSCPGWHFLHLGGEPECGAQAWQPGMGGSVHTTYTPGLVLNRALLCGWLFLAVSQPGGLPGVEGSAWGGGQKKPPAPAARSPGSFLCSAGLRERDAVLLGGFPLLLRSDAVHRLLGELEVSPSCPPATWFPCGKGGDRIWPLEQLLCSGVTELQRWLPHSLG